MKMLTYGKDEISMIPRPSLGREDESFFPAPSIDRIQLPKATPVPDFPQGMGGSNLP
jgi:hypothetical protein